VPVPIPSIPTSESEARLMTERIRRHDAEIRMYGCAAWIGILGLIAVVVPAAVSLIGWKWTLITLVGLPVGVYLLLLAVGGLLLLWDLYDEHKGRCRD
jgi:hypothetical protein